MSEVTVIVLGLIALLAVVKVCDSWVRAVYVKYVMGFGDEEDGRMDITELVDRLGLDEGDRDER